MPSDTDKLKCIERELVYRKRVYPRLVAKGTMSEETARHEIALMQAIADDYRSLAQQELLF
ncbi:hypothetical protein [Bradyrhizobium neotropicale]|uniref:hypothetical protein n=1 Tax=Bradyrhizobium neotropicale TaxID=1497615 RepID=UPI001AD62988|nr:hypothetical protein [Bradyrhizobium neotropicale]MBO4221994.1 hypothetical protein [Bradyrhizobium neotropicale]